MHELQAHALSYRELLEHFRESVEFVGKTPNPAIDVESISDQDRMFSMDLMKKEVASLLSEIRRLEGQRLMLFDRLHNATLLVRHANTSIVDFLNLSSSVWEHRRY